MPEVVDGSAWLMRKEDTPTYIEDGIVGVHDEDHTIWQKKIFLHLRFYHRKEYKIELLRLGEHRFFLI